MPIRLTEDQQDKLFKHIREKWGPNRPCPMCGHSKWTVDATVYRLAAMTTESSVSNSIVQPLATVRCRHCSHMVLIHLTQSGVATPTELSLASPDQPGPAVRVAASGSVNIDSNDETH